jgi:hypothetical protein
LFQYVVYPHVIQYLGMRGGISLYLIIDDNVNAKRKKKKDK